jgi:hypothetical protein
MSLQDGLTESNSELINMKSWVEKELLNQKNKPDSFIGPF